MKRILYSCLLGLIFLSANRINAQTPNYGIGPNPQCTNSSGIYTATAQMYAGIPGATSYSWTFFGACTPTIVPVAGTAGSVIALAIPCCGDYTLHVTGYQGLNAIQTLSAASAPVSGGFTNGVIYCATGGVNVTVANPTVCLNNGTALTASGGTIYSWYEPGNPVPSSNTTAVNVVSPTQNSTYTVVAVTAQNCTVTGTASVAVSAATITASALTQTICAGSTICFTATVGAINTSTLAAGTVTTSIAWYEPGNNVPISNALTTCTPAQGGNYTAVLTYTGSAGTCTAGATVPITIGTNINVSATASSNSICPNNQVTLTAQSLANNYTWTPSTGGQIIGNPIVVTPSVNTCYVVDADYSGCPGSATVCVGMLSLTPTLASSSPSICPATEHTLTASGGDEYTFYYLNPNPVVIGTQSTTNNFETHAPATLPATYVVVSFQNGCTGSDTLVVYRLPLTPTMSASSPSICPGTNFTLSVGNVGAGANYSFVTPYTPTLISVFPYTATAVVHNAFNNINNTNNICRTYTVYADSAGCVGNANVTVCRKVMYPALTASSPSVCPGTQFTLTATNNGATNFSFTPTHTVPSTFTTSSGLATITSPTNLSTPRIYTVVVDSSGCRGTQTVSIGKLNLNTVFNFKLLAPTNSVCPNRTYTLSTSTGTGTSIKFYYTSTNTLTPLTANTATHSSSQSELVPFRTYTVTGDSLSCTGTSTLNVSLFILTKTLTANPNPVCANVPLTLTVTGKGNQGNTNFTFLKPATPVPTVIVSSNTPSVLLNPGPNVATSYSVVVDSANCVNMFSVNVNISPPLVVNGFVSTPTICSGNPATLTVNGPTNALYQWYDTTATPPAISGQLNYTVANGSGIVVNPTVTTIYKVIGIDPAGCQGISLVTLSVNPAAQLNFTVAPHGTTICPAPSTSTAQLWAFGAVNYTWAPSSSLNNAFTPTVIASPSVTTVYTITANNGLGCIGRRTLTLTVGQNPNPSISATANSVCPGFTSTLTAFGANSYTWTGSTFTNAIAQQSIAVTQGTYQVVMSNGGTCTGTTGIVIGPAPPLNIQLSQNSATTCIENNMPKYSKPVILSASGAANYAWFPYNPAHMTYSLGPSTTVRPPATTQYTVIGSTAVCSGSQVITVTVVPQFTFNVTPPLPAICLGDSIKLNVVNVSSLAAGPASKFSYWWEEAANAPPISVSSYFTPSVNAFPQNTTTYTVEVADSRMCVSVPRLVTVTVLPRPTTAVAIPTINNVPTNTVCFVGPNTGPPDVILNLTATNTNTNLQFGVVPTYTWLSPYPKHNSILTPPNNNAVAVSAPVKLPSVVVYSVVSGYNGVPGCRRVDTVSVRVVDCRPVTNRDVKFVIADNVDTVCTRECITFINLTDTAAGGPQKTTWTFRGGNPSTSTFSAPTVCYNIPGEYDVILRVESPYPVATGGSTAQIGSLDFVRVVDVPNVSIISPGQLRSDTTVRFGTAVTLNGKGGKTYQWSPNYNISSMSDPNVVVKPFRTTQYILTGYNSKRCSSNDTINVIVIEDCGEMYVPNAFSPNGDGHNDVMRVRGICLQTLSFMIFNRWGEKVFETTNQEIGWDGTYKGQEVNSGVFVYRLEGRTYDGKGYSSKGNITLIR